MFHPFVKSIKQGAQTTIYCAVDENAAKESGLYYDNCRVVRSSQNTYNAELANQLWKRSCEILNLPPEAELGELLEAISNKEVGL
ncbi:Retinol dehydrogenase 12 [Anthophora quadrimaculata]